MTLPTLDDTKFLRCLLIYRKCNFLSDYSWFLTQHLILIIFNEMVINILLTDIIFNGMVEIISLLLYIFQQNVESYADNRYNFQQNGENYTPTPL